MKNDQSQIEKYELSFKHGLNDLLLRFQHICDTNDLSFEEFKYFHSIRQIKGEDETNRMITRYKELVVKKKQYHKQYRKYLFISRGLTIILLFMPPVIAFLIPKSFIGFLTCFIIFLCTYVYLQIRCQKIYIKCNRIACKLYRRMRRINAF